MPSWKCRFGSEESRVRTEHCKVQSQKCQKQNEKNKYVPTCPLYIIVGYNVCVFLRIKQFNVHLQILINKLVECKFNQNETLKTHQ